MIIGLTNLVFELIIQKNFYSQTRRIYIRTKGFQIGSHLCIGPMGIYFSQNAQGYT